MFRHFYKEYVCKHLTHIGQTLSGNLFTGGIRPTAKVKSNIKNSLMSVADKILLRKRALIETANDELEDIAQIEHSGHRSFNDFIANSPYAIAARRFFGKKPAIDLCFVKDGQLTML